MNYFKHETAIIDTGAVIGDGTKIWHFTHVSGTGVQIGTNCSLGQNVYIGNNVALGNGVKIQNNVSVYEGVEIEDEVFCGPSMVFTNVINPRSHIVRKTEYKKTIVRRRATIGANATIVCGNEIGIFAFVAAGAVVTKDVKPYSLVAGVPARQISWICECGNRLPSEVENTTAVNCSCADCGQTYRIENSKCEPQP